MPNCAPPRTASPLNTREASERYDAALSVSKSLGASTFDARLATVLADLGVAT